VPGNPIDALIVSFSFLLSGTGFLAVIDQIRELSDQRTMYFAVRQAPGFEGAVDAYLVSTLPEIEAVLPETVRLVGLPLTGWSLMLLMLLLTYRSTIAPARNHSLVETTG
jgi:hypothetical protein